MFFFKDIGANLTGTVRIYSFILSEFFLDPVYQGIYHSKLVHPPDLDAVLQRSYDIGVKKVDMSTLLSNNCCVDNSDWWLFI